MRAALLMILVASSSATADETHISGFVTSGGVDLAGSVTDLDGNPMKNVVVHIAPSEGKEMSTKTDRNGEYKVRLPNDGPTYVYVEDTVKIVGQLSKVVREADAEAIAIRETLPPLVPPRAKIPVDTVLQYSAKAQDKNQWTRAWLLLDVDATGTVRRVKLLNRPGLDMDALAVHEAFSIRFTPARDRVDHPVESLVVWTWEWPAYYWYVANQKYPNRLPPSVASLACIGSGPVKAIRDCTKPALAKAVTTPWIERP